MKNLLRRIYYPRLKKIYQPALNLYGCHSIRKNGFWFVDIPRTSSSSIRSELGKHFGRAYGKTNVNEREYQTPQIFRDHITARKMKALLGNKTWESIFTFTIVRNPWERIFSMYHYRKKRSFFTIMVHRKNSLPRITYDRKCKYTFPCFISQ